MRSSRETENKKLNEMKNEKIMDCAEPTNKSLKVKFTAC